MRPEQPPIANGVRGHQQTPTARPPFHVLQRHHENLARVNPALQTVPLLPQILRHHNLVLHAENLKLHPSRDAGHEVLVHHVHRSQTRGDDEEQQPLLQRREPIERPRQRVVVVLRFARVSPRVNRHGDDPRVGEASHEREQLEEDVPHADVLRGSRDGASPEVDDLHQVAANLLHVVCCG